MRPNNGIVRVAAIDIRIEPYTWDFARDDATRIDAHWARLVAEKPALYDGRVLLAHRMAIEGDRLVGGCCEVSYRSFLAWRDFGFPGTPLNNSSMANCFAMPALRALDGAFVLGEMSPGTANAGRLYFPAGTPEPSDAGPDGRVDFEANILRELEEETGLTQADVVLEPVWTIVFAGPLVACMRVTRTKLTVEALQTRLAAFNAWQAQPELTRLVPVRGPDDIDAAAMPTFMRLYLAFALGF